MSYILEALKKSEQERGRGGIPGVQTVHSSSLSYHNKKTYWPYILIAAVLLNLIAILYFILSKDKPSGNIAATPVATVQKQPAIVPATPVNDQATQPAAIKQQQVVPVTINRQAAEKKLAGNPVPTAPLTNSPQTGEQDTTANSRYTVPESPETYNEVQDNFTQTNTITDSNAQQDNTEVMEFDELPESIKQQIPAIVISAHVYSTNPMQRSIVINNNFMEEGEYFMDGMIVDEITPDGAIFSYKDTRFHLGVVSGWQ